MITSSKRRMRVRPRRASILSARFLFAAMLLLLLPSSIAMAARPAPAVNLSVGAVTDTSVSLWWTATKIPTLQYYEAGHGSSATTIGSWRPVGKTASCTISGLSPGTTYWLQVRAVTKKARVDSNVVSARTSATPAPQPPSAPTNLAATAVSSSRIDLGWTDNSTNESGFKIERATSFSGPFSQVATVGAGMTSYSSTGLAASTTYYYRVCAYNVAGNSGYSNTAHATTQAAVTPPSAPAALTATALSDSQISLGWQDASSNESGFKIERSVNLGYGYGLIATVGVNVTSYQNAGLPEGTTYYYRVCAYNSSGDSGYSNVASDTTKLKAPSNLAASPVSSSQIDLAWQDNSSKESCYIVERLASGHWSVLATLPANTTAYSDSSCQPATTYYYCVKAGGSDYCGPVSATTPPDVAIDPQWIGKTPAMGEAYQVAMYGGYAYVTSSLGLQVVDISDPARLLIIGSLDLASAYGVAVDGTNACVTDGNTLKVVNVGDPGNPFVAAVLAMPDYVQGVCLSGTKAYAACYRAGLVVVDIANPYSPRILGSVDTPGQANDVSVVATVAVVADGTAGIAVVDVANPSVPRIVGSLATAGSAWDVELMSGYAYVAAGTDGLLTVNVGNPAAPRLVGKAATASSATGIALSGSCAHLAISGYVGTSGLQTFDVSSVSAPVSLSFVQLNGTIRGGVAARQGLVCCAAGGLGLNTVSTANPSSPVILGRLPQVKNATGVAASGSFLYTTMQSGPQSFMHAFDVTDPSSPVHVGILPLAAAQDISVDGSGYAYVADGKSVKVVSVLDPGYLHAVGTVAMPDYVYGVCASGDKVYAACYLAGLVIVDVSNPAAPWIAGAVDTPGQAFAVSVVGSVAVVADGTGGVRIVDVANASSPRTVGSLSTAYAASDVDTVAGYAYVAARKSGLLVVNIANPSAPQLAAQAAARDSAVSISVADGYAFLASASYLSTANGLQIFDIQTPTAPEELSFLPSPGMYCRSVAVSGRSAFLADDKYLVDIAEF